jgi:hypothetical protein
MSDPYDRIQSISLQKDNKKMMTDENFKILSTLADEIVELHNVGGIELEQWETAHKFVKLFYNTEEVVEIRIGSKR